MRESPTINVQIFPKWGCLRRDGFRCLATGLPEENAAKTGLVSLFPSSYSCHTELAHIIPFTIGHKDQACQNLPLRSINVNPLQEYEVSQIWTTLRKTVFPTYWLSSPGRKRFDKPHDPGCKSPLRI